MSDPYELLSSMARPDDGPLEPGTDPAADALLARIVGGVVSLEARRRRRRRRAIAVAGVVAVVGAGSAAAAIWTRDPVDAVSLRCYGEASTEPAAEAGLVADPGLTPVEQCSVAWSDGSLGTDGAPPLVACVDELDSTVVVPGDESTCATLGWALALGPDARDLVDAEVGVRVPAVLYECQPDPAVATASVQAVFDEVGATGWTVTAPATSNGDCLAPVIDGATRTVTLVPLRRP